MSPKRVPRTAIDPELSELRDLASDLRQIIASNFRAISEAGAEGELKVLVRISTLAREIELLEQIHDALMLYAARASVPESATPQTTDTVRRTPVLDGSAS